MFAMSINIGLTMRILTCQRSLRSQDIKVTV